MAASCAGLALVMVIMSARNEICLVAGLRPLGVQVARPGFSRAANTLSHRERKRGEGHVATA